MLQGGAPPADEAAGAAGAEGAAGGSGGGGDGRGISLSGDELKAFLAKIKAGGGGGGGGGTGLPPQLEQLVAQQQQQQRRQQEEEAEAGSQQPKAATVDDPEFAKYWKAPVAGRRVLPDYSPSLCQESPQQSHRAPLPHHHT